MLLGKYYISTHAADQYFDRTNCSSFDEVKPNIRKDLRTLNIKNIVYKGSDIHVFTKGYKEFIFARSRKGLCLKTFIKRNYEDTIKTVYKRKTLCN